MKHQVVLNYGDLKSLQKGNELVVSLGAESVTFVYERVRPTQNSRNARGPFSAKCRRCHQVFRSKTQAGAAAGLRLHRDRVHKKRGRR